MGILITTVGEAAPEGDQDTPATSVQRGSSSPDFLFGRPDGSFGIRGSWVFARAGSDWYDFVTDQLTVDRKDFNAPGVAADLGFIIAPRIDAVFGVEFNQTEKVSEYRRFVDNNRLPINQTTELRMANLTGSVKIALRERGREISRLAWVPRDIVPFVGAGAGALWYGLKQTGDFVDFTDRSVFTSSFVSKGWAPSAHVFGGVDVRVFRRAFVTVDGRYQWAAATLSSTWVDFDPIDLAGFRLSLGMNWLF
jgi:hypothetical protein